eukprot:1178164-Prorocentrum_minimum.AAC.2
MLCAVNTARVYPELITCAGIPSRQTNETQEARVYYHGGPIRRRKREYILAVDQSDARSAHIFSQRTNQTQEAWVCSHDGGHLRPESISIPDPRPAESGSGEAHVANQTQEARVYSHEGPIGRLRVWVR